MRGTTGQKGFSLVEIMIVVAVIAILAMFAAPSITASRDYYRLRADARELVVDFKRAKIEAIKYSRDACIDFLGVATANGSYRMFVNVDRDAATPHTFDNPPDIPLIKTPGSTRVLRTKVEILSTNFPNNQACYDAKGLPRPGTAGNQVVLQTSDGTRSQTLTVSPAGNVRLQ